MTLASWPLLDCARPRRRVPFIQRGRTTNLTAISADDLLHPFVSAAIDGWNQVRWSALAAPMRLTIWPTSCNAISLRRNPPQ